MIVETPQRPTQELPTARPPRSILGGDTVRLTDLIRTLRAGKTTLFGMTIAGTVLATGLGLIIPVQYQATAIIVPPQQQQSMASALLGQIGSLATMSGRDLGLKNPADVFIGLARSRSIADSLIRRFNLQSLYKLSTMEDTRKRLGQATTFETGKDTLIKISVDDRDPQRAADIVNAYIDEMYQQNRRLAMTESAQRRLFFEQQLETERSALNAAELAFQKTQQTTGVLQVNTQAEMAIRTIAQLRAEITAREVGLDQMKLWATANNPQMVRLETELSGLRSQLHKADQSPTRAASPLISAAKLPEAGLEYVRGLREVVYHQTVFEVLARQYVAAKIDEAKEAPLIQTVDRAVPPDKKIWPPRTLFTLGGAVLSFLLACALVLVRPFARLMLLDCSNDIGNLAGAVAR
jgi:tyrosine-protein kinase Etk/Wzc